MASHGCFVKLVITLQLCGTLKQKIEKFEGLSPLVKNDGISRLNAGFQTAKKYGKFYFLFAAGAIEVFLLVFMGLIDRHFKISERGSSVKTEISAGIATFAAMSYIIAVNPIILSSTGMDKAAVVSVTALTALLGSLAMGLYANLPVAVAPGMGTNSYFAFIICAGMGLPWQAALSLTFYNGIFFVIISLSGVREKIVKAVPKALQTGLQCGIGLFIAFMGLQHSGLVVKNEATMIALGDMLSPRVLLSFAGFVLMACLVVRKFRASILLTIVAITALSFFVEDASGNPLASLPESPFSMPASFWQIFMALDFAYPFRDPLASVPVIFTLLLLDMFDSVGTIIALGRRTGMMNDRGEMEGIGRAFLVDSGATVAGALMGTSTVTCFAESAAGIEAGGRTGLAAAVAGLCFLGALFITPAICSIPEIATAPALIFVGIMMMSGAGGLDFRDHAQSIPAVFCMLMIMLTFSITQGLAFGVFMYVAVMLASGRWRDIALPTWVLFAMMAAFMLCISI